MSLTYSEPMYTCSAWFTSATGTPIRDARSRSTRTHNCGACARNVLVAPTMPGSFVAATARLPVIPCRAGSPSPA